MNTQTNQLPFPPLLSRLLAEKRWHQPSDDLISSVVPFLRDPVDFLLTEERIRFESRFSLADFPDTAHQFHLYRSSAGDARSLPWLDADLSLFIAVNRHLGDDVGVALDYRTSFDDPRVVASDWSTDSSTNHWREVSPTFSVFVQVLRL